MPLVIPNSIDNDTPADAAELQENFGAIQAYVNTNLVNRDGSVALTSPLLLPGDPSQGNHAANKGYVDGRDALYLPLAGGTVAGATVFSAGTTMNGNVTLGAAADLLLPSATSTLDFGDRLGQHINLWGPHYGIGIQESAMYFRSNGQFRFFVGGSHADAAGAAGTGGTEAISLGVTGLILPEVQSGNGRAAVHLQYVNDTFVNLTGDTIQGQLIVNRPTASLESLRLLNSGDNLPFLEFRDAAQTTQYAWLRGTAGYTTLSAASGSSLEFRTNNIERMRLSSGLLLIGKGSSTSATTGIELHGSGGGDGVIYSTVADTSNANLWLRHISAADAVNSPYVSFRDASNNELGYIKQSASNANALTYMAGVGGSFVNTSDYRLKNVLGPVEEPLDRLMALQPRHLEWKPESRSSGEFDGFLAHEVQEVVPAAVQGDKDGVEMQGLDASKLVPLLVAAVQQLAARVAELEAAA